MVALPGFSVDTTGSGGHALVITGSGDLSYTDAAGSSLTAAKNALVILTIGSQPGSITVRTNGILTGRELGIDAVNRGTDLTVTTGVGSTVTGGAQGIAAENNGTGVTRITTRGAVTGAAGDGIYANSVNGSVEITVHAGSTVTARGGDDFAIGISALSGGSASITVGGTLTGGGGGGGAIQFDKANARDDRLELHPSAVVNGNVFAGAGVDILAFGGAGDGIFDLDDIDTGGDTEQYRGFETFQVDSGVWTFSDVTTEAFTVNGGMLGGTGAFGALAVNNGPGDDSIGWLTVNGAFTLNAGAIYEVEVNAAGQSDQVIVKGIVDLTGATLRVPAAAGDYQLSTDYTIIDNDGDDPVVGRFAAIRADFAFLVPTVVYNGGSGNDVVLTLERVK